MSKKRKIKEKFTENKQKNDSSDVSPKIHTPEPVIFIEAENNIPANNHKDDDLPPKETAAFFGTLVAFFAISFVLKYIFPNVPEYVFERILLVFLAAFCAITLWKLSPELRNFVFRRILRKNIPESGDDNGCGLK